jgi:hypothetical protein
MQPLTLAEACKVVCKHCRRGNIPVAVAKTGEWFHKGVNWGFGAYCAATVFRQAAAQTESAPGQSPAGKERDANRSS